MRRGRVTFFTESLLDEELDAAVDDQRHSKRGVARLVKGQEVLDRASKAALARETCRMY